MKSIIKSVCILSIVGGLLICICFGYFDLPIGQLKEKYALPPSAFMTIDGMDVHFRDEGNKSDSIPIVLLHGTGSSLHTYDAWADALKTNYRVIRMDLPGFGLTGPFPNRKYSMDKYVQYVERFLTKLNIEKCILGGNSLGGRIAWNHTVKNPSQVEKLILIDASGYPIKAQSTPIAFRIAAIPVLNKLLTFITPKFMARSSVENVYADKSKVTDDLVDRYFDLTLRAATDKD